MNVSSCLITVAFINLEGHYHGHFSALSSESPGMCPLSTCCGLPCCRYGDRAERVFREGPANPTGDFETQM